jgi:hypothetical protein
MKFNHKVEWSFEVDEKDYTKWDRRVEKLLDWWQDYILYPLNKAIFSKRKRKIQVRIDNYDVWSADHTLAMIIYPVLLTLKDQKHGSCHVDMEDVPEHLRKEEKEEYDEEHEALKPDVHDRWDWVLDEMIWTFKELASGDEGRAHYYVPYEPTEDVQRVGWFDREKGEMHYMLTEDEARNIGKLDRDLYKKYQDRVDNGLRLFAKYYRGLWD